MRWILRLNDQNRIETVFWTREQPWPGSLILRVCECSRAAHPRTDLLEDHNLNTT